VNKLIRAEWIKFRTLRFNWSLVAFGLVLNIVLLVIGLIFFDQSLGSETAAQTGPDERILAVLSPQSLLASVIGVIAVLIMASEYKSKTVIPSFAAAPIRSEVIAAKAFVAAAVALVVSAVALVVDLAVGLPVMSNKGYPIEIGDDHFIQAAGGVLIYAAFFALFGLGLGILLKNSVLSITLIVAIPMVVEPALGGFLPDWIARYMPFAAGGALTAPGGTEQLSAWQGGGVLGLWAVGLLIAGGVVFERRDLGNTS
jgi:ABC-type transport system involved in multi-copper enzyme maturation permease subunit